LMLASLTAVVVVLILAFMRVIHYEIAYGYTIPRVYAQVYMIGFLVCICALAWDVLRPLFPQSFFLVMVATALIAFTSILYWNVEAWIVHRNVDRYLTTGKIDMVYLQRLSYDALPTLDDRLQDIDESQRRDFWDAFAKSHAKPKERRWFEWNWRWERAKEVYLDEEKTPPFATMGGTPSAAVRRPNG
jgi:hypothetical protein